MTSFRFSATRFQRSVKIFAALGAFCFSVAITILLCGGSTFLDPQLVEPFRITKDVFIGGQLVKAGEIDNGSKTFFLFPGRVDLMLAGAFYIATLSIFLFASAVVAVGSTYYMCTLEQEQLSRDQKFIVRHPFVVLFALPLAPLIFHLCANLHWQFYCAVEVIDSQNCFWVFDGRSLLIGFAGICGLCICLAVLMLLLCGCRLFGRFLSFVSCWERVEKANGGETVDEQTPI